MKLAHIINPVKVPSSSDLHLAQPVTFESIRVAQQYAQDKVSVELYTVCYAEDREIIPGWFTKLADLNRSVRDVANLPNGKKLPLINDILQSLYNSTTADYLIYTNMDIALMPQFYAAVSKLISINQCDALLINRRGLTTTYKNPDELPLMYAEFGKPHPGFDCFVFKRELLNRFMLENICIGVPFIEVAMVHNLIAFAQKLKLVDDMHLTFHLGSEVMPPVNTAMYNHNRNEYEQKIYPRIKPYLNIRKFPYALLPFHKRMLKWILNPVFRTHQVTEMEGKDFMRRIKYRIDSWRFSMLEKTK